jgi:hypothetical protein
MGNKDEQVPLATKESEVNSFPELVAFMQKKATFQARKIAFDN